MELSGLEELLAELRHMRTDHQAVEAKRASKALPETTHETLSAFANTDGGGLLLLGVDEASGAFNVTGVDNPQQVQSDLQSACSLMEPQLRASVDLIAHPDGVVIAAIIPSVPRNQRPCHLAKDGAHHGSFIRVGDGDQNLGPAEVTQMLADRTTHDHSISPAPQDAELDPTLVAAFTRQVRISNPAKYESLPDEALLRQFGASTDTAHPTYAGYLTMGRTPEQTCAAARITYRVLPNRTTPVGTRHEGRHLEGTIPELLDDTLATLEADLKVRQLVHARGAGIIDVLDVPREALREVISNALIHRSLAPGNQRETSILIEVTEEAVVITSPGSLHSSADTANLGLTPIAGVRNYSLVRQSEQQRTPTGARVSEHQNSGIASADRACHEEGAMPVLFIDRPTTFQAILLRGTLDPAPALAALSAASANTTKANLRLLSVLHALDHTRENVASSVSGLNSITFDARFAARALAPTTPEDAAAELRALEDRGLIRRTRTRLFPAWVPVEAPQPTLPTADEPSPTEPTPAPTSPEPKRARKGNRVLDVLDAIAGAPKGQLAAKNIGEALQLSSPTSRNRWIRRAEDDGLIVSTVENPYNPHGAYKLTHKGRMTQEAQHRKNQQV